MTQSALKLSQARAFLAKHSAMAYDDARTKLFWQKAKEEGATVTYLGATFPDGSDIEYDAMSCSLSAS